MTTRAQPTQSAELQGQPSTGTKSCYLSSSRLTCGSLRKVYGSSRSDPRAGLWGVRLPPAPHELSVGTTVPLS